MITYIKAGNMCIAWVKKMVATIWLIFHDFQGPSLILWLSRPGKFDFPRVSKICAHPEDVAHFRARNKLWLVITIYLNTDAVTYQSRSHLQNVLNMISSYLCISSINSAIMHQLRKSITSIKQILLQTANNCNLSCNHSIQLNLTSTKFSI